MIEPLVTVVVPIYNVESKLKRCVDSILNQTYRNLEVILVDDGSPDNCPKICDDYAKQDGRVKVIHKTNAGLGFARNTGIDNANGKYICFFDSDDCIDPTTIEESCMLAQRVNADLVCFGHIEETSDGKVIRKRLPEPPKDIFIGDEIREKLIPMALSYDAKTGEDWNLSLSACFAFFSTDVIRKNNHRFESEREVISEDIYFVLECYGYCKTIAFIRKPFYHYITNPCSLTRTYRTDRYKMIKIFANKLLELSKKMELEKALEKRVTTLFLGLTIGALKNIVTSNEKLVQKYNAVKQIVKDEYMQKQLSTYNFGGEKLFKHFFISSMKNKHCLMCYAILWVKCITEK